MQFLREERTERGDQSSICFFLFQGVLLLSSSAKRLTGSTTVLGAPGGVLWQALLKKLSDFRHPFESDR